MGDQYHCKRCKQDFPNPGKLRKHLEQEHGSASNHDPRKRLLVLAGAALVAAAIGFLVLADDDAPSDTRAGNLQRFGLQDDPFLGDPDAPVVLVGFESPHCSSCQRFHNQILPGIKQELIDSGDVVYYYVQATINHPTDLEGSIAQECAHKIGGPATFWNLTDTLYGRPDIYASPDYRTILEDLAPDEGLDPVTLTDCYDGRQTNSRVSADYRTGRDHNVRGTPTFFAFGPTGEPVSPTAGTVEAVLQELVREAGGQGA